MIDEKKKRPEDEVSEEELKKVAGGKLTVGKPKDVAEREADTVAERVVGDS